MTHEEAKALSKGCVVYEVTTPAEGPRPWVRSWQVEDTSDTLLTLRSPESGRLICQRRKDMSRFEGTPKEAARKAADRIKDMVAEYQQRLEAAKRMLAERERLYSSLP